VTSSDPSPDLNPEQFSGPALGILQRITQPKPRPRPGEACDLCGEPIPDEHSHLVDLNTRSLRCTCRPCALLFDNPGAAGGRYRLVPERYRALPDLVVSSGQWDQFDIPVSVAFFFFNSQIGRIAAFYPGPAGATESLLPLEIWEELAAANPILTTLEPDVEALLARTDRNDYFLVPIDACYELVGHLRKLWKGFDGGQEARAQLDAFFDRLHARSVPVDPSGQDA
jgi:hypothetical protein